MDVSGGPNRPDRLRVIALLNGGLGLIAIGVAITLFALLTGSTNLMFVVGPSAWALAAYHGAFHAHISRDEFRVVPIALLSAIGASLVVTAMAALTSTLQVSPSEVFLGTTVTAASLISGIFVGRICLRFAWRRGQFRSTAVVAGSGPLTSELALELTHRRELGIDLVNHVDLGATGPERVSEVFEALRCHRPDRLIIGETELSEKDLLPALRFAGTLGSRVYVLPRLFSMGGGNPLFSPDQLRGFPLQRVNRSAHPRLALAMKRGIDIAVSAGILIACSPLLLIVGVLVKVTSPGPLLFWQERLGLNNQLIRIPKFRSMKTSDTSDFEWTAETRITPFGHFLRRSAIDELPQLWSVLRGDMSLVGPRPERPAFASQFSLELAEYNSRLRMRTGLTGLAQIAGLRGDTSISERAKYDNLYIDQWSVSGDIMILLRTVGAIVGERRRAEAQLDFEAALSSLGSSRVAEEPNQIVLDERTTASVEQEQPRRSIHA